MNHRFHRVINRRYDSIVCPRCHGDGRIIADVLVAMHGGHPVYELQPQRCYQCQGAGRLRRYRPTGTVPVGH